MKNNHQLDIVIPVRNSFSEKKYSIYFTLKMLLAQKKIKANIIVVDDGSTDQTVAELRKDFSGSAITVLSGESRGAAAARNLGAKAGRAEYILFIDDDTITSGDLLLEQTLDTVQHHSFGCGAIRYWTPQNWNEHLFRPDTTRSWLNILNRISYLPKGVDRITGGMDLTHVSFIGNYGIIKRSVFEEVKGYPESYNGWGLEDTHLMYILCLRGYDYVLLKDAAIKVFHLNHPIGKHLTFISNLEKFRDYQKTVGVEFSEAAFFDEFDGTMPVLRPIER